MKVAQLALVLSYGGAQRMRAGPIEEDQETEEKDLALEGVVRDQ